MGVRHTARVYKQYMTLHIKTLLEYRTAFFTQALFMFLNDVAFISIFYFLFAAVGTVHGYGFREMALVFGITAFALGVAAMFVGGYRKMAVDIMEGKLDIQLSQPFNELLHIGFSSVSYDGLGDALLGLLIIVFFLPEHALLLLGLALIGAVIFTAFEIMANSLAFFFERPKNLVRSARFGFITYTIWPADVFPKSIQMFIYVSTIAFIATVPFHIAQDFSFANFGWLVLVAVTTLSLSVIVFKLGLRRYESGNLIGMRG